MKLRIINEKENKLFNRREIEFEIDSSSTPSYVEVIKLISKELSTPIENIKIKEIKGRFGRRVFTVAVNIYSSKEEKENLEQKSKKEIEMEKKLEAESQKQESKKSPEKIEDAKQDDSSKEDTEEKTGKKQD